MTLMSGKVYSDAGTPSNTIGDQGDIFMQLDGLKTTYRKEGGAWTPIGNQLGTIPEFLKGIGAPSNAAGEDGQYYREVNTDAIYQKDAGAWANIGSWTSLEIQQLLLSNGIGADLAVTNHVSNIDTFIEAGAEGYFDNTTTGTKPSIYGLVKVRRENGGNIYQAVHGELDKLSARYSNNGGINWTPWRVTASQDGDNTRKFKALAGTDADDVAVIGQILSTTGFSFSATRKGHLQLPNFLGGFILQWELEAVTQDINPATPSSFTFDIPFPSNLLLAIPTFIGTTSSGSVQTMTAGIYDTSLTGLKIKPDEWFGNVQDCKLGYLAIGN